MTERPQYQPSSAAPHVPAAFINALAEEGTKDEAIFWLQKQWNENCSLRKALEECQRVLAILISPSSAGLSSMHVYTQAVAAECKARATLKGAP